MTISPIFGQKWQSSVESFLTIPSCRVSAFLPLGSSELNHQYVESVVRETHITDIQKILFSFEPPQMLLFLLLTFG